MSEGAWCTKCGRYLCSFERPCKCQPFEVISYYTDLKGLPCEERERRTVHAITAEAAVERYCDQDLGETAGEVTNWLISVDGVWFDVEVEPRPEFIVTQRKKAPIMAGRLVTPATAG